MNATLRNAILRFRDEVLQGPHAHKAYIRTLTFAHGFLLGCGVPAQDIDDNLTYDLARGYINSYLESKNNPCPAATTWATEYLANNPLVTEVRVGKDWDQHTDDYQVWVDVMVGQDHVAASQDNTHTLPTPPEEVVESILRTLDPGTVWVHCRP